VKLKQQQQHQQHFCFLKFEKVIFISTHFTSFDEETKRKESEN
jgi:hypothetical protein